MVDRAEGHSRVRWDRSVGKIMDLGRARLAGMTRGAWGSSGVMCSHNGTNRFSTFVTVRTTAIRGLPGPRQS